MKRGLNRPFNGCLNRSKSVSLFLFVVFNASLGMLCSATFSAAFGATAFAMAGENSVTSSNATVKGVQLHYLKAGHGTPLILLHGYAETSLMWKPIMPALADHFSVIAPDLPGIGDSAIPDNGLDMKSAAMLIHELARSLGIQKAEVIGHDIGLMVAYAYAAQFPKEVQKLVLMDAFLPGIGDWTSIYNSPDYWHFRFHGPTRGARSRKGTNLLRLLLE